MKRIMYAVLALLMVLSSTSFAVPVAAPVVESASELEASFDTEVVVAESETQLSDEAQLLSNEEFASHPQYGIMLFNMDFDMSDMVSSAIKSGTYTLGGQEEFKFLPYDSSLNNLGVLNPAESANLNSNITFRLESAKENIYEVGSTGSGTGVILETDKDGNTYAKIDSKGKWPNLEIRATAADENGDKLLYNKNGVFTYVGDFKMNEAVSSKDDYSVWAHYWYKKTQKTDETKVVRAFEQIGLGGATIGEEDFGEWRTVTKSASYSGTKTVTENEIEYDKEWVAPFAAKYGFTVSSLESGVYDYPVYLDNLKLYYKPFTANLTVDMNGNTVATPIVGLTDYSTTKLVDISALEATVIDHGDKIFEGFSFTKDGEIIKDDFYLTQDTTIYAIWHTYTKNSYSYDMDTTAGVKWGSKSSIGSDGGCSYGIVDDDTVEGNKFLRINFVSKDDNRAILNDTNIYFDPQFNYNLPISNIDAIQIRLRYSELPDMKEKYAESYTSTETENTVYPAATDSNKYTHTYNNKSYSITTSNMQNNIYFYTNDGTRTGLTEKRNEYIYPTIDASHNGKHGDKWVTLYLDCDNKCFDEDKQIYYWTNSTRLKTMRFDFANSMLGGTTVDIDYVHFIERENNPANEEKTSIRTSGYTGIRFLASIKEQIKKNTEEYGFLVTRKTLLDAASLKPEDLAFSLNKETVGYVSKASYSKTTGEDFVYALDKDNVFFTGLMTGIPEDMLDDVIVVRPYSKVNGEYSYGTPYSSSILETAEKAYNNGYLDADGKPMSDETVVYLKKVLGKYGKPYELDAIYSYNAEEMTPYAFSEDKCTFEIVDDPDDPTNKVYKLTPLPGSKWSYIWFSQSRNYEFVNGATYSLSAKVKLVDDTLYDMETGEAVEVKIMFSENGYAYYLDGSNIVLLSMGGILHVDNHYPFAKEGKFSTTAYTDIGSTTLYRSTVANNTFVDGDKQSGRFGFYVNPFIYYDSELQKSMNYKFAIYIDDIVIKKIADPVIAE